MQKKLIALAVAAAAAAPAFAQSNVTIYGVADVYYGRASADGAKTTNVINSGGLSGSRLGFKGTEALGNGLSALFVLEYGLNMDDKAGLVGTGSAPARQQLVGLTGGFGTVVAGSAQTAGYDFACANNPVAGSALDAYHKVGSRAILSCGQDGRASNAFAYISPNFAGATIAYNHARVTENATAAATGKDAYANLIGASYANGPIGVNAVWSKVSMANTDASDDVQELGIGGSYDLKVVKLMAQYQTYDNKAVDNKNNKIGIAAAIPVGPAGAVAVQYARSKIKETVAEDDPKSYTIAYTHGLSKRTTAYAGYNRVTNASAGTYASVLTPTAGGKSSVLAAGVRHTF
jgi:general bacterial porin, GBP family